MTETAIKVRNLQAWYGESHVLHGIDLDVGTGKVVSLLGRNGAGRTTILRALMGLMVHKTGDIQINGEDVSNYKTYQIARLGLGYCPEERGIFSNLSCYENLMLPPNIRGKAQRSDGMPLEQIYELFPNLKERGNAPGSYLSGGEQQMLAVARILRAGAKILLIDEISEGLAPVIVETLGELIKKLKEMMYTVVLVEQNFHFASGLADSFYVIEHGKVVKSFLQEQLDKEKEELELLLGV